VEKEREKYQLLMSKNWRIVEGEKNKFLLESAGNIWFL
jgi:hypothetical protein